MRLTLNSNNKAAELEYDEVVVPANIPCLTISIYGFGDRDVAEIDIPLDTLRGKLNELEMMTQR